MGYTIAFFIIGIALGWAIKGLTNKDIHCTACNKKAYQLFMFCPYCGEKDTMKVSWK